MSKTIKQMNRKELMKLRSDVDRALKRLDSADKKLALEAVRKAARAHGFSLSDLTGAAKAKAAPKTKKAKKPVAAKYRNPADASQTWSGRGRRPAWVNAAMAKGTPMSKLEI